MLIYRGDAPGIDGLREILGAMAQQFDRRMLLARWNDGETMSYMITMDDALVVRGPAFQPLVLAFPDGACLPVQEAEPAR
jgi:hypothetical protein